jgi:hypothetical protein
MTQKSGINMIEELLDKISLLDKRFEIIEQNTKELLNRSNMIINSQQNGIQIPQQNIELPNSKDKVPSITGTVKSPKKKDSGTRVLGIIKNKEGKVLIGVNVTIINKLGRVVKVTKTNKSGEWLCFLPPDRYRARYFLDKHINTSVNFEVKLDQTLLRVAQPRLKEEQQ